MTRPFKRKIEVHCRSCDNFIAVRIQQNMFCPLCGNRIFLRDKIKGGNNVK